MTRVSDLCPATLIFFLLSLFIELTTTLAQESIESDVEDSRVFGKSFVHPIQVGAFPPVCVVEPICGPNSQSDFKSMRDVERPAIMIFCRDDLKPEWKKILVEVDRLGKEHKLPIFLIITMPKGIAGEKPERFDPMHYLRSEQVAERIAKWKSIAEEMGLEQTTAGVAVNRFWRDSIGYADNSEILVAYVRGKVLTIQPFVPSSTTETEVQSMIYNFTKLHLQTK
ncbi:MAG: hypothetical protein JNK90_15150 [Planctomycetaceae bacterium]|nr:hypothetical protein [Planctomycetaceae bacterium]